MHVSQEADRKMKKSNYNIGNFIYLFVMITAGLLIKKKILIVVSNMIITIQNQTEKGERGISR